MPKMMLKWVFMGAAGVLMATAGAALAGDDLPQKTVRFADADLNDPAQAKAVLGQLKRAAKEVCDEGSVSPNGWVITDRQCEQIAVREAVYTVRHPGLSAAQAEDAARHRAGSERETRQMAEK